MEMKLDELRALIREVIAEDLKNVGGRHQRTVRGTSALKKMHDAPGVLKSLSKISDPKELAQVIQALIDAVPITSREDVLRSLGMVTRHERKTHLR